jgi:hypothetical protein
VLDGVTHSTAMISGRSDLRNRVSAAPRPGPIPPHGKRGARLAKSFDPSGKTPAQCHPRSNSRAPLPVARRAARRDCLREILTTSKI